MKAPQKTDILIVDDTPENLVVMEGVLECPEYNLIKARSGDEALALMLKNDFALAILDVQMPGMDGFETAELMRGSERTKHIPIIFVTAISKDDEHVFKGYDTGAVDYIFKPFEPHVLRAKVKVFYEMYLQKKQLEVLNKEMSKMINGLEDANRKILEQQKSVIEEERLKVLLQFAGATAHELNQPLMGMMGNIELMRLDRSSPDVTRQYVSRIEESAARMSRIIQKIQTIKYDQTTPYPGGTKIIDIEQKINILVADDKEKNFEDLKSMICINKNLTLKNCSSLKSALQMLKISDFDLILFKFKLPDGNGFDMLDIMRRDSIDTPLIMITDIGNELTALKIIQAGAYDYLKKGSITGEILINAIMNTLEKARLKKQVESTYKRMVDISTRDDLTGLYNRRYFLECLKREYARARRYETGLILCMLDIDEFQAINNAYGHQAGDKVLAELGSMLIKSVRTIDVACRYGGEEFALILPHTDISDAHALLERFRQTVLSYSFQCNSSRVNITVSTGIAKYKASDDQCSLNLIKKAEKALMTAKEKGRNITIVSDE